VYPTSFPKFAVNAFGESITIPGAGFSAELLAPLQPVNWYPGLAVAFTPVTVEPAFHQLSPPDDTVPPAPGFDTVVKLYCLSNTAVYVVDACGAVK
jgi:hypothetical protein